MILFTALQRLGWNLTHKKHCFVRIWEQIDRVLTVPLFAISGVPENEYVDIP